MLKTQITAIKLTFIKISKKSKIQFLVKIIEKTLAFEYFFRLFSSRRTNGYFWFFWMPKPVKPRLKTPKTLLKVTFKIICYVSWGWPKHFPDFRLFLTFWWCRGTFFSSRGTSRGHKPWQKSFQIKIQRKTRFDHQILF